MNDLNQIRRQNARATLEKLNTLRRQGYHCVIEYQGLHAVDIHAFKSFPEAKTKCGDIYAEPGAAASYYPPIFVDVVDHFDQIETSLAQQARSAVGQAFRETAERVAETKLRTDWPFPSTPNNAI